MKEKTPQNLPKSKSKRNMNYSSGPARYDCGTISKSPPFFNQTSMYQTHFNKPSLYQTYILANLQSSEKNSQTTKSKPQNLTKYQTFQYIDFCPKYCPKQWSN